MHPFVSLCDAIMQKYRESQSVNPKPMSQIIYSLLCYLSLSARWWSHSTRPFVFCSCSAAFFTVPACINVSRPPHRLLIYESYPGLSLLSPVGGIDVESVTRRIAHVFKYHEYYSDAPWPTAPQIYKKTLEDNFLKYCIKFWAVLFSLADRLSCCGLRPRRQRIFRSLSCRQGYVLM